MTSGKKARQRDIGGIIAPADMRAYAEVLPDFPERYLAMVEKRQNYMMEARKAELHRNHNREVLGRLMAFAIVVHICALAIAVFVYG